MTVRAITTDLAIQRRRLARRFGDLATGAGLWVAILGFCLWAAVAETDAFAVGVVVGSVLVLGAIGLTLIYGILKFAHFAHGDAMMLAAYVAFFALTGTAVGARTDVSLPWSLQDLPGATTPIWDFSFGYGLLLAVPLAALVTVVLFLALDALVYAPLRRRRAGIVIFAIASLGIAIAMRSFVLAVWGPGPRFYVKGIRPTIDLPLGPRIVTDQLFIAGVAVVLVALVYLLLFRTRIGRAMRATADNAELARVAGIDTDMVVRWTWVVSAALVAIAGVLLALQSQLKPELGFVLLLPLFAATVLGGIGSPQGALAGGLFVGIAQEVAVTFDVLSPGYKFSVAFVILILVILIRPRGLFGTQT
ncbi:MAG TPA: branched-chain amino acid ABC transporter permease [Dehalococcoidia bacterium]|nr:branched-chain amino acid ABC transporter permease [Dehalococcoidia bacterium]